MAVTMSKKCNN